MRMVLFSFILFLGLAAPTTAPDQGQEPALSAAPPSAAAPQEAPRSSLPKIPREYLAIGFLSAIVLIIVISSSTSRRKKRP